MYLDNSTWSCVPTVMLRGNVQTCPLFKGGWHVELAHSPTVKLTCSFCLHEAIPDLSCRWELAWDQQLNICMLLSFHCSLCSNSWPDTLSILRSFTMAMKGWQINALIMEQVPECECLNRYLPALNPEKWPFSLQRYDGFKNSLIVLRLTKHFLTWSQT